LKPWAESSSPFGARPFGPRHEVPGIMRKIASSSGTIEAIQLIKAGSSARIHQLLWVIAPDLDFIVFAKSIISHSFR
jgi:hypothetical protein